MNPDTIEQIRFPEPKRSRRPRIRYAPRPSAHGHWTWILPLYLGLVLVGVLVGMKAPTLFLPFCGIAGAMVFFTVLYGVIRSAVQK